MSPETHVLLSWIVAAKTTDNPRDCRLVALAGVLPDADGLGIFVDWTRAALGHPGPSLYQQYHHFLLHGAFGAAVIAGLLTCFAKNCGKVALLALLTFHLHLFCDYIGSRGPSPADIWPICYLEPFRRLPIWMWRGQWQLDGWQNKLVFLVVFVWAWRMTLVLGHSVVGVFNRRADAVFVRVVRGWQLAWRRRWSGD
jgi:inner membrane protein